MAGWMLLAHPASGADQEPAAPADLLEIWQDYGLPLPPPEAPLVRFPTGVRTVEKNGVARPQYSLGFLIREATDGRKPEILAGFIKVGEDFRREDEIEKIEPNAAVLKDRLLAAELGIMGENSLLGTALQCEARGWGDFARTVLDRSLQQSAGHHFEPTYQAAGTTARTAVYLLVWRYLQAEAMRPGNDRAALAAKMKRLLDSGHDLPRGSGRWLYDALHAAAQPGKGKPGTPEALIDRLVDSQKGGGGLLCGGKAPATEPYDQLEALGFAAVPALLDHLDDPRLTCSMMRGFNNFPDWPRRVGDLASDLLQNLAGDELGANWLDRQKGTGVAVAAAREWWRKVQAVGEEAWLVRKAVAKNNDPNSFPNDTLLRILTVRYPNRLPDVLEQQAKRRPLAQLHPVITALVESNLPEAEKSALLKKTARHSNPESRRASLLELVKYDSAFFNAAAIKEIDAMAKVAHGPYWESPEAKLSHLALRTADAGVWAALLRATRRAEVGLRLELMNPMNYSYVGDHFKEARLAYLGAFLDDTALRELPKQDEGTKYSGPCAGFTFPRLRVCDFAAMQYGGVLAWPDQPDPDWSQPQWDTLRGRAKAAQAAK